MQTVEKELLLGGMHQMKSRFDEALRRLRTEKIDLAISLKAAEVQVIVLVQEHSLLVDFSSRDNVLAGKLSEKHAEQKVAVLGYLPVLQGSDTHAQSLHTEWSESVYARVLQEIMDKMGACQQQVKDFKAHLVNVASRKAEIVSSLQSLVSDTHPQHEALMTIFNRKVKRVRKSTAEDEEESEDDEDDDGDDDDDLSDEDAQQETCPPGCDQALYEEVLHTPPWPSL